MTVLPTQRPQENGMEQLLQVTAPHFTAGLVIKNGWVIETAPILAYMIGWTTYRVKAFCHNRRWELYAPPPKA